MLPTNPHSTATPDTPNGTCPHKYHGTAAPYAPNATPEHAPRSCTHTTMLTCLTHAHKPPAQFRPPAREHARTHEINDPCKGGVSTAYQKQDEPTDLSALRNDVKDSCQRCGLNSCQRQESTTPANDKSHEPFSSTTLVNNSCERLLSTIRHDTTRHGTTRHARHCHNDMIRSPQITTAQRHPAQPTRRATHQSPRHNNTKPTPHNAPSANPRGTPTQDSPRSAPRKSQWHGAERGGHRRPIPTAQRHQTHPTQNHSTQITMAQRIGRPRPPRNRPRPPAVVKRNTRPTQSTCQTPLKNWLRHAGPF